MMKETVGINPKNLDEHQSMANVEEVPNLEVVEDSIFKVWKTRIDDAELTPEDLENYLDLLKDIPLSEEPQQAVNFLINLIDKIDNSEQISRNFWSEQEKSRISAYWISDQIDQDGFRLFFLRQIFYIISPKIGELDTRKDNKLREKIAIKFLDSAISDFRSKDPSYFSTFPDPMADDDQYDRGDKYLAMNWHHFEDESGGTELLTDLVRLCGQHKFKQALPKIIDGLDVAYGAYIHREIAETLSSIDADLGADQMLKKLKTTDNEHDRSFYSAILYRMELGQIHVQDGSVQYLEKDFKLQGEQKDKIQIAFRITGDGKIGLFDDQDQLIGYFELGDLTKEEQEPLRQIMDNFDQLAFADPDSDPKIIDDFKKDYLKVYKKFHDETNVRFSDLTIREQVWFYQYLQEAKTEQQNQAKTIAKDFGRDGIKAFISLEMDREAGDKIFAIAQNYDQETAKAIFRKYAELADTVEGVGDYLKNKFGKKNDKDNKTVLNIVKGLLGRGTELLTEYGTRTVEKSKALSKLNQSRTDVVLFTQAFKAVKPDLNEVEGMELVSYNVGELSPEDKKMMLRISRANWVDNVEEERRQEGEETVAEFSQIFKKNNVEFHVLKKDGQVISFLRYELLPNVDPSERPHCYAGSFNVDPDYRGSGIGSAVIDASLNQATKKYVLEATASSIDKVGTKYVEYAGFNIVGTEPLADNLDIVDLKIVCDIEKNKNMHAKKMTHKDLAELYNLQKNKDDARLVQSNEPIIVRVFDPETDNVEVIDCVNNLTASGYIGTRYYFDPNNKKQRYYVFEKDKAVVPEMSHQKALKKAA
ncbi:MAG: GNAT family N-acetyltransferase [bacterium]